MTILYRTMLAILTICLAAPAASALAYDVGVKGRCYDSSADGTGPVEGSGGEGSVGVRSGSAPDTLDAAEVLSIANAVLALADNPSNASRGEGCNSTTTDDELEAHVRVESDSTIQQEVCYNGQVRTDGSCYLTPTYG